MQKITPFLWFDNNPEEAFRFYPAIFKGSRVLDIRRYDECTGHHGGGSECLGRPATHIFEPTLNPPSIP